ncbi:hypothetical protein B0H12DRAFT_1075062 [Mycena haematopus]|nr:hypothetical protein B0H12DRAFT_1075062 [Mycena haematopus]
MSTPPIAAMNSSLDVSYICEDDLSGLGVEFFQGVPGLQSPAQNVDPSDSLHIPTLPMHDNRMPPPGLSAEEQAEMLNDPDADDPDQMEIDELEESPVPRRPSRKQAKQPLHPMGNISPLRYPRPATDDQLGGGYPHREATPPEHPPATRLRAVIPATTRATGNKKTAAMHTHREKLTESLENGAHPAPAAPAPFVDPFATAPTAPAAPATFVDRFATTRAAAGNKKRVALAAAPAPFGDPAPAAIPATTHAPVANPATARVTGNQKNAAIRAAAALNVQPAALPSGPSAPFSFFTPQPPTFIYGPTFDPSDPSSFPPPEPFTPLGGTTSVHPPARRPVPRPKYGNQAGPGMSEADNSAPSRKPRATTDEPSDAPTAQARADATPKSKRRAPSAEPVPRPGLAVDTTPLAALPALHSFSSRPNQPTTLSSIEEEQMHAPTSPDYQSDDEEGEVVATSAKDIATSTKDVAKVDDERSVKDLGGRPSRTQATMLSDFVAAVRRLAQTYGTTTNLPPDRFLTAVVRSMSKGSRGGNGWNTYESFARCDEHVITEYQRIRPDFDPDTMDMPSLSTADLSAMYKKFQEAYPDGEAESILEQYSELVLLQQDDTLASRQRQFDKICNGLRTSIHAAHEKEFEAILFICGSYVHEDTELAGVIATPALETAFAGSLKHSGTDQPLTASDLLGIAKICAYSSHMNKFMEAGVTTPEAVSALGKQTLTKISTKTSTKAAKASATTVATTVAKVQTTSANTKASSSTPAALSASTSTAVAPIPIKSTTGNINAMRDRFTAMSIGCLRYDVFRDKGGRTGTFIWIPLGATLADSNLRLLGYPANVRLPGEVYSDKASGSWRALDLTYLNISLLEHESSSGWGLRLEHHDYTKDALVIITHDYTVAAPDDATAAAVHWQTSRGEYIPCQDAYGNVWSACVDVRRAGDAAISKTLLKPRKKGKKGKEAAPKDAVEKEVGKPKAKMKAKTKTKTKTKGKGKGRAEEEEDEDEDEEDEEEEEEDEEDDEEDEEEPEPEPEPVKSKAAAVKSKAAPAKEVLVKGGSRATTVPAKTRAKRKEAPVDTSDFFDEDSPEVEEQATPPLKKLRSAGPPTPIPPPAPRHAQAMQEGGGKNTKPSAKAAKKPVAKQVAFAAEASPEHTVVSTPPANDPAAVAERRRRARAIPPPTVPVEQPQVSKRKTRQVPTTTVPVRSSPPPDTYHQAHVYSPHDGQPIASVVAERGSRGREFLIPKTFAVSATAGPSRSAASTSSATAGPSKGASSTSSTQYSALPPPPPPPIRHQLPPEMQESPVDMNQLLGQVASIPPHLLGNVSALIQLMQRPQPQSYANVIVILLLRYEDETEEAKAGVGRRRG